MTSCGPFTPEEIRPVLGALTEAGCVIIGGQAVNLWSSVCERIDQEPWSSGRPYTSFDADAFADSAGWRTFSQSHQSAASVEPSR